MSPHARRTALQAAAKVAGLAFAASVLACERQAPVVNANTAPGTDPAATQSTSAASPSATAPPIAATSTGGSCTVADEQHATADELACCKQLLAPAIAAGPLRAADHGACCGAVVYENEAKTPPTQSFPERNACCSLVWGKTKAGAFKWDHSFSCTPWGPPVPPESDDVS
jgi:hypothetical protein